jgi:hypothetical protein
MNAGTITRLFLYAALVVLGVYIIFGFVSPIISHSQWYVPFIITIAGIFILQAGNPLAGVCIMVIGLFFLGREVGLITAPLLRYGMGGATALIGSLGILRELRRPEWEQREGTN